MSISHINGIALSTISHLNGISKAGLSHYNGLELGGGGVTTDYGNPGGMGDRTAMITVSSDGIGGAGGSVFVDGSYVGTGSWFTTSMTYLSFDFGSGKVVDEAAFYQQDGSFHGDWKWQGSNDASSWTDIGSSFTLGGAGAMFLTSLAGNVTFYRYYQMVKVSGSASDTPWIYELDFKISA